MPHKDLNKDAGESAIARLDKARFSNGSLSTSHIRSDMQHVMQNHAAVFRTEESLAQGVKLIDEVYKTYSNIGINDRGMVWNSDLVEA